MQENKLIKKLFEDLFEGNPWLDVTILGTLKNVTAEKASGKFPPISNSIWEIVNHLIDWRLNVLQRVQGKVLITPNDNYFKPVKDTSQAAWEKTIERLQESQEKWLTFLEEMNTNTFSDIYPTNTMTYYEHIHGIIQHDAYHLGQISLLVKCV
ncbi:DinB family protein [Flavobacterium sangjuense]|uniref:DinB-like domain-containing protein n=1 Tax=Flavobacterium sangjuense TaxID=2518177 RepID=A0A4P7PU50_9FLAO|nr:DinB family protein [Flavobacterium sangjuense]QBZ98491.1 hypothetical protein GS03_01999 [Flavobacterium sangjuense]